MTAAPFLPRVPGESHRTAPDSGGARAASRGMLILPEPLRTQLLAQARAALPYECCGLLEGVRDGGTVTVTALHPAANLSPEPESGFEIDPAAHFAFSEPCAGRGERLSAATIPTPTAGPNPQLATARTAVKTA